MANMGQGTTISFGTSAWTANLLSVGGPSITRAAVESTHMGTTTAKTYILEELYDAGECEITVEMTGTTAPPVVSQTAVELITIDWGGLNTGYTWSFQGGMTAFNPSAEMTEKMQATATIKAQGVVTIA